MNPLSRTLEKRERLAIGLMSGTSADGVDAVLVAIEGCGAQTKVQILAFDSTPHEPRLRAKILAASRASVAETARLHREIAESFAKAAERVARRAKKTLQEIDLIGSHGQTVFHHSGDGSRATLQLGDGCFLAERTGCHVVSDFRQRDLAAQGEGAPISAWPDWILFGKGREGVAVLNLGGIANVSLLGSDPNAVLAFDTGPANMVIDGLVIRFTDRREHYDREGALAARGRVREPLLAWMLEHPFLAAPPPKSTGRETFGDAFVEETIHRAAHAPLEDLVATATAFTAKSVALGIERARTFALQELVVGGGGTLNPVLMESIRREVKKGIPVVATSHYGVDPQAREAIAMAILANETIHGLPGNRAGATGAERLVPLGKISLAGKSSLG